MKKLIFLLCLLSTQSFSQIDVVETPVYIPESWVSGPSSIEYSRQSDCEAKESKSCFEVYEFDRLYGRENIKIEDGKVVLDEVKIAAKKAAEDAKLAEEAANQAKLDQEKAEFEKMKEKLSSKEGLSSEETNSLLRYLLLKTGDRF